MVSRILLGLSSALFIVTLFMSVPSPAYAQTASANRCKNQAKDGISFLVAFPTWYKYLELDKNCEVKNFEVPGDIWKVALAGIEILLRVAGFVAFGATVLAGFKFVLSRGNPSEASKARQAVIDAIIGVGITGIAIVLVSFLGRVLTA